MNDDDRAIEATLGGDSDAFEPLVRTYQQRAIGHATAILGNREDARDVVQQAFVDAFKALRRFERGRDFYPWFYTLMRNRALKRLSRGSATKTTPLGDAHFVEARSSDASALDVNRALAALSPEDRELVVLKHLDGLSYEELAGRLGIPAGTVMSRLHKARRLMHAWLTRTSSSKEQP